MWTPPFFHRVGPAMRDRGTMSQAPQTPNGNAPPDAAASVSLEQRVRRLEDVVAGIQDTWQLEERIAKRVSDRVRTEPNYALMESAGLLVSAGRQLLPATLAMKRPEPGSPAGSSA